MRSPEKSSAPSFLHSILCFRFQAAGFLSYNVPAWIYRIRKVLRFPRFHLYICSWKNRSEFFAWTDFCHRLCSTGWPSPRSVSTGSLHGQADGRHTVQFCCNVLQVLQSCRGNGMFLFRKLRNAAVSLYIHASVLKISLPSFLLPQSGHPSSL